MDFEKIGLKCGLEVHQQLDTKCKLFCSCPTIIRDDKPDYQIKRMLRAAAGETGEIDVAAEHEQKRAKYFVYEAYSDSTCLVEADCEPPHQINKEALDIVLQIALILNSNVIDEVQFMRKTVADGSNTSGFQRTALIATNGHIETELGNVRIDVVCLEEDAAKIVSRTHEYDIYNLSKLGIPLVEIGTKPDIKTPEQAKDVAAHLGMILRSTGKVKRGIGTIRQDVNVSIKDGDRVEIKGAQDLRLLPKFVEYECLRQQGLIKIKNELKKTVFENKKHDVTKILKNCESKIIRNALEKKGVVLAVKLNNFSGFLGRELQPGHRLGTELSDYAKIKAGISGLFHSDELPKYGITEKEVNEIKKELKCTANDAFIIIADQKEKVERALDAVMQRAKQCFIGIPREVRKPNPDGTTSFLRPMPGAARMYPETDVKPVKPDTRHITLPKLLSDKYIEFEKLGLSRDLAKKIAKSDADLFEELLGFKNVKPAFIAETLISYKPEVLRRCKEADTLRIKKEHLVKIFEALNNEKVSKNSVIDILVGIAKGEALNIDKCKLISDKELKKEIEEIIQTHKGLPFNALMGIAMSRLKGKADGKKIAELLKELS